MTKLNFNNETYCHESYTPPWTFSVFLGYQGISISYKPFKGSKLQKYKQGDQHILEQINNP